MLQSVHIFLLQLLTAACGTKLPSAKAASCPQRVEGDIRALAERSGFDPKSDSDWRRLRKRRRRPFLPVRNDQLAFSDDSCSVSKRARSFEIAVASGGPLFVTKFASSSK